MIGQLWWLLQCQPREVQLRTEDIYITNVECGTDGTMFLSHEGELYACGNNQANKLGLNEQSGWVFSGTRRVRGHNKVIVIDRGIFLACCLAEEAGCSQIGPPDFSISGTPA